MKFKKLFVLALSKGKDIEILLSNTVSLCAKTPVDVGFELSSSSWTSFVDILVGEFGSSSSEPSA